MDPVVIPEIDEGADDEDDEHPLTAEQTLDTIRNNARFAEMKSAIQKDPEKFTIPILGFISKLSPEMAEAVVEHREAILHLMNEDDQVLYERYMYIWFESSSFFNV
jgi:hypothetical protein